MTLTESVIWIIWIVELRESWLQFEWIIQPRVGALENCFNGRLDYPQQGTADAEIKCVFSVEKPELTGSKHIKSSKERYLLGQKRNLQIFRVNPYVELQNDEKWLVCFT